MKLEMIRGEIKPAGWLKEFLRRDLRGITGNLDKLFPDAAQDIFGKEKVVHKEDGYWSSWWTGETNGNWIEAYVRLAFVLRDSEMLERARAIVYNLIENQEEDGYIGIYVPSARYVVTKRYGELWTQSRAMRTMLAYYENTQDERVLDSLERMADNIVKNVKESVFEIPDEDGSKGHSLMIIDGLYGLWKYRKKDAYRDFCLWFYEDYCAHASQFLQDDLRMNYVFNPEEPFVGHGPHTCEMLRIPLLLFYMTGDSRFELAWRCGLIKMQKNLELSGSCKSDEFIGTYQCSLVMENDLRTTVFGGSLPLPSTAYEYCSTAELAIDYYEAVQITGDISFGERFEWLVYNAGLASKHPSGKMIQYLGADNMYDASACVNPRFDYSPTHDDAAVCCAPNSCKLMPLFVEQAFLQKDDTVIANLFLPLSFRFAHAGGENEITETTEYPFRYGVKFTVKGAGKFPFAFRLPSYAKTFTVTKNGAPVAYETENGIVSLEGKLKKGDTVAVEFHPEITVIRAVDGTYALSYGTLLFAKDIPADCKKNRKYDLAGFWDCDYTPKAHEDWNYTLFMDACGECAKAQIEYPEGTAYPLDTPSIVINVKALDRYAYPVDLKLVPIGATTLRRTTFPVLCDTQKIYKI
jgi:hypothetical protein